MSEENIVMMILKQPHIFGPTLYRFKNWTTQRTVTKIYTIHKSEHIMETSDQGNFFIKGNVLFMVTMTLLGLLLPLLDNLISLHCR